MKNASEAILWIFLVHAHRGTKKCIFWGAPLITSLKFFGVTWDPLGLTGEGNKIVQGSSIFLPN